MLPKRIFFVSILLSLALLFVWSRIHVIELGYEVSRIKGEVEEIKQKNSLLQSKLARSVSAEELAKTAEQYKMRAPTSDKILFVEGQ